MNFRRTLLLFLLIPGPVLSAFDGDASRTAAWWDGKQLTSEWFGGRTVLEENGVSLDGHWRGIYFGVLASEGGAGNAFAQDLVFAAEVDASKALRWEGLEGAALFGEVRWRDPGSAANPNTLVQGERLFNPSRYAGGTGWRLLNFGLRYSAPEFFGVKKGLTVTAGWLQPQKEFVEQPLARLFANNAIASAEGLGANIPFGSSFSTWGGTVEVKPASWHYVKTGLFMAFPNPTNPRNNGLMFRGYESEPGENGLFFLGETGLTPEIGAQKLPGRYAFGAYFYGENNEEYGDNKSAYYWQADQMMWREEGDEGLRMFNLFVFAPAYNNDFTFYLQSGLVYRGLLPARPRDEVMAGLALGRYSEAAADDGMRPSQTVLMEAGYRIKLNGWSFVQPFAQYISNPAGDSSAANAAILGVFLGVDF